MSACTRLYFQSLEHGSEDQKFKTSLGYIRACCQDGAEEKGTWPHGRKEISDTYKLSSDFHKHCGTICNPHTLINVTHKKKKNSVTKQKGLRI